LGNPSLFTIRPSLSLIPIVLKAQRVYLSAKKSVIIVFLIGTGSQQNPNCVNLHVNWCQYLVDFIFRNLTYLQHLTQGTCVTDLMIQLAGI
jgi:hypothetical protein